MDQIPLIPWLESLPFWPEFLRADIVFFVLFAGFLALGLPPAAMTILTWLERKVVARIQDRIGPNRAGPFGLLQAIADTIKMLTKEDITPDGADRIPFNIAPGLVAVSAVLVYAVIPFGPNIIGADLNIGVFYVMAVGSFGILGILMAGWSSNNKYALLGAFRAVAQLVSYEIPMVISLITVVVVAGSMSTVDISRSQALGNYQFIYLISMPLTFLIFFISGVAETGRSPFDLLEAESEIIAGFHVEYTGLKFGLFMIGEYVHMFAVAMLTAILFLGGFGGPFVTFFEIENEIIKAILGIGYFLSKTLIFVLIMMWFRGTLPRFRIDHLLDFGWKFLVPVSLINLVITILVVKLTQQADPTVGALAGPLGGIPFLQPILLLVTNLGLAYFAMEAIRAVARRNKDAVGLRALASIEN
ncbi:MAG: NADH-quinone oxidoreductase subunit NuoH [Chloroflexota bacterium]